jgi:3-isopropylmalate/(R)-2-methylmalate dehydratase small subunit
MEKLTTIIGTAVPMLEDDINTDVIFPARYLLLMDKDGLGDYLFFDRRTTNGDDSPDTFVLDRPAYKNARILLAGANFGCGSSREQAVWTLKGAGFDCVIAPSFGEIFHSNCFKNGLLPISLPASQVARLAAGVESAAGIEIDLLRQYITLEGQPALPFSINEQRRQSLINGRDEIDDILINRADIDRFEARHHSKQPWLFMGLMNNSADEEAS